MFSESNNQPEDRCPRDFATTHRSAVLAAGDLQRHQSDDAVAKLTGFHCTVIFGENFRMPMKRKS